MRKPIVLRFSGGGGGEGPDPLSPSESTLVKNDYTCEIYNFVYDWLKAA